MSNYLTAYNKYNWASEVYGSKGWLAIPKVMASHSVSGEGLLSSCQMTQSDERIGGKKGYYTWCEFGALRSQSTHINSFLVSEHFFLKKEKLFLYSLEAIHIHIHLKFIQFSIKLKTCCESY